jgi:hypothetical protein
MGGTVSSHDLIRAPCVLGDCPVKLKDECARPIQMITSMGILSLRKVCLSLPNGRGKSSARMILVGPVVICVFAAFFLLQKPSAQQVSIIFTGSTNSVLGVPSASFLVSNITSRVLFVTEIGFVQTKERGVWNENVSTQSRIIGLLPHETFVVSVPKPSHCDAWRVFVESGGPRSSFTLRVGNLYEQQPLQFEPLSYLLLAPVLHYTRAHSQEIK